MPSAEYEGKRHLKYTRQWISLKKHVRRVSLMLGNRTVSVVSAPSLGCDYVTGLAGIKCLSRILQHAAATLNLSPEEIQLPWQEVSGSQGPSLLAHRSPAHKVQLLALAAPQLQRQQTRLQRSALYTTAILQHAAFLLLLLVSDSVLLHIPAPAVPAHILQLLHVLPKVRQQLLQQFTVQNKKHGKAAISKTGQSKQRDISKDLQQGVSLSAEATAADDVQDHEELCKLLQKPATQLHVLLQVSSAADAPTAVQQAEHTLLRCKAATAARAATEPGGTRQTAAASVGAGSSGLLFELASVHAGVGEQHTRGPARRAVLKAIQQQLFNTNLTQLQLQDKEQQQQQQLPTVDKLLASLAATAAASTRSPNASVNSASLQHIWQQLLQLLFPQMSSSGASSNSYPFYKGVTLEVNDISNDDVIPADSSSDDDADWDTVGQHDSWQEVDGAESAAESDESAAAGDLLAAAVDPLYHLSSRRCLVAARAALRAYIKAVPPRYPLSVHQTALRASLHQYITSAAGPAAADVQQQLQEACLRVWCSGRQQCSAVSITGRLCALAPHNPNKVPHSSGATFLIAAPDGSEQQQQQQQSDWFSFADANIQPALELQQHQQQQEEPGYSKLLEAVVELVHAQGGSSSSKQQQQQEQKLVTGTWFSLWGIKPPAAAAAAADPPAAVALPGQRWLPGFNHLLQLRVLAVGGSANAAAAAAAGTDSDGSVSEDADEDATTTAAIAGDDSGSSSSILQGILQGINIKGSRGAARKRGEKRGGKTAAAAGADSWSDTLAQAGNKRSSKSKGQRAKAAPSAAAAAAVPLGLEDFPTLAEAATGAKKGLAAAATAAAPQQGQQQQGQASTGAGWAAGSSKNRSKGKATAAAGESEKWQQQLIDAWAGLDQKQQQQYEAGSSGDSGLAWAAGTSDRSRKIASAAARGGAPGRGRGRGQKTAAAAAADKAMSGAMTPPNEPAVLTSLWIGLEYESLSGMRTIIHPKQLLPSVQQQEQQLQQEQATAAAAAVAAAAAARNLPAGRGQGSGRGRGGRAQRQQQQQQRQDGSSTPPRSLAAVSDSSSEVLGVEQLVLQDVPLFLPAAVLPGLPARSTASPSLAAAAGSGMVPLDANLLQLKRLYIRTPPAPYMFASRPRISFRSASASATAAAASNESQAAVDDPSSGSSSSMIEFTCGEEVELPADSLLVLNLPQVFGAPSEWVQVLSPAAVQTLATAGLVASSHSSSVSDTGGDAIASPEGAADGSPLAAVHTRGMQLDDAADAADAVEMVADKANVDGAASSSNGVEPINGATDKWLPLILVDIAALASAVSEAKPSGAAGGGMLVPGPWSACLRGGSWLYPAAMKKQA